MGATLLGQAARVAAVEGRGQGVEPPELRSKEKTGDGGWKGWWEDEIWWLEYVTAWW